MQASEIKAALRRSYCQPEWVIFFEVTDGTGAASRRRADAIAMNMWPSRGLELRAIEIKVSRADLANELRNPAKAEAVAQYCDTFYLATPTGLVKGMAIPHAWGLIEVSKSGRAAIKKQAALNDAPPDLTKTFMAGLLRAAGKTTEDEVKARIKQDIETIRREERASAKRIIEREKEYLRMAAPKFEELLTKLTEIMGAGAANLANNDSFLSAVRLVYKLGLHTEWEGLGRLRKDMKMVTATAQGLAGMMDEHIENLSAAGQNSHDD